MSGIAKLHGESVAAAVFVIASAWIAGVMGAFFPHVHGLLVGGHLLILFVLGPEAIGMAVATMVSFETMLRRENYRQFTLRELLLLTTTTAVMLSLLATERLLAQRAGKPFPEPASIVAIPAFFGLACAVYNIASGIEAALFHVHRHVRVRSVHQSLDDQMPDWLSAPESSLPQTANKPRRRHHEHVYSSGVEAIRPGMPSMRSIPVRGMGLAAPVLSVLIVVAFFFRLAWICTHGW